jgi:nitroreductase
VGPAAAGLRAAAGADVQRTRATGASGRRGHGPEEEADDVEGEGKDRKADFLDLARTRRSIRRYRPDPVEREVILNVLEAARWAPSAVNSQPWHFIVVTDPATRQRLAEKARVLFLRWRHLASAPVVIAVIGDPRCSRWFTVDCSLAGANLMLAAHSLGLGTCWVGGFSQADIREVVGVPEHLEIVGLITLGHPDESPKPPPRLPLERLVSWERFEPGSAASRGERFRLSGLYSLRKRLVRLVRSRRKG